MTGLVLAALLAADAGVPHVVSVRHALVQTDDGETLTLDGGVWLDDATAIAKAQRLAQCSAELEASRQREVSRPISPVVSVVATVLTALVVHLLPRP